MSAPKYTVLKDYKRFKTAMIEFNIPGEAETIQHYVCMCPKVIAVLPITEEGNVVLVKQFRPLVGNTIEIPAGCVEEGEDNVTAAKRELEEETGYQVLDIQLIKHYRPSSGYSNEETSLYFAKVGSKVAQHLDKDEKIEILEVSVKEAFDMLEANMLEGPSSDIALRWYVSKFGNSINTKMEPKLLILPGMEELGDKVLRNLKREFGDIAVDSERVDFKDGTNKITIKTGIWGSRVFILIDPYNYSVTYKMRGKKYPMDPDKHMMSLLRAISAIRNDAEIIVIMPAIYDGRQDKRNSREDLITSMLLKVIDKHVKRVITFDIHSDGFQHAMDTSALDSFQTARELLNAYMLDNPKLELKDLFILGTDGSALKRARYMTKQIGGNECKFATCGKLRSDEEKDGGTYVVERHELFGKPELLKNKNVLVTDDMIDTGGSLVDVLEMLRDKECNTVDLAISFGIFTEGIEKLQSAKEKGLFRNLYVTNLVYLPPKIKSKRWVKVVDESHVIANIIKAIMKNKSLEQFF